VDENGACAALRRRYGGPPGTGFVRIRGHTGARPSAAPFLLAAEWRPGGR